MGFYLWELLCFHFNLILVACGGFLVSGIHWLAVLAGGFIDLFVCFTPAKFLFSGMSLLKLIYFPPNSAFHMTIDNRPKENIMAFHRFLHDLLM